MMCKRNIITQILRSRMHGPEGWTRAPARGIGLGPDLTESNKNIPKHPGGAPARGIGLGPDPTESNKNIPKHPAYLSNKAENPVPDPYGFFSNMKLVGAGAAALASLITLGMCYTKGGDEKEDGDSSKPKDEDKSNEPAPAADAGPKEEAEKTNKDSKKEDTKKLDTDLEIENIAEKGEPKEEDKRDDYVPQFSS